MNSIPLKYFLKPIISGFILVTVLVIGPTRVANTTPSDRSNGNVNPASLPCLLAWGSEDDPDEGGQSA